MKLLVTNPHTMTTPQSIEEVEYPVEATHLLQCRHCRGNRKGQCRDYTMPCILLGYTKRGLVKVLVWGDLFWPRYEKSRVRYVEESRLCPITN